MKTNVIIGALLIFCVPLILNTQPTFAAEKEVFIQAGDLFSVGQTQPIEDLIRSIGKHKKSSLFRVTWWTQGTLGGSRSVALYNRKLHTLKYFNANDWLVSSGDDGNPVTRRKISRSILYTGVKDAMMPRLLKEFDKMKETERCGTDVDTLLPKLVKFGAKKRQLSKTYRKYVVKQNR